jgi:hypothetical protein
MGATEEILSSLDLDQLAQLLGTDKASAGRAAAAAIPTLIGGLQANSGHDEGANSLLGALSQHADDTYSDSVNLADVDTEDGRKIVAHALAEDPKRVAGLAGIDGDLLSKLLPLLAPVVMSYLAKKLGVGSGESSSGGVLGDLLGGLLGGSGQSSSGGLGDLLGGLLGNESTGNAIGDLLGGLLGGDSEPATTSKTTKSTKKSSESSDSGADLLGNLLGQILGR